MDDAEEGGGSDGEEKDDGRKRMAAGGRGPEERGTMRRAQWRGTHVLLLTDPPKLASWLPPLGCLLLAASSWLPPLVPPPSHLSSIHLQLEARHDPLALRSDSHISAKCRIGRV
ncbi:hypothetical protein VDGL01_05581 [Verticillium dahliae]